MDRGWLDKVRAAVAPRVGAKIRGRRQAAIEGREQTRRRKAEWKLVKSWNGTVSRLLTEIARIEWSEGGFALHTPFKYFHPWWFPARDDRELDYWWVAANNHLYAVVLIRDPGRHIPTYFKIQAREVLEAPLSVEGLKEALARAAELGPYDFIDGS